MISKPRGAGAHLLRILKLEIIFFCFANQPCLRVGPPLPPSPLASLFLVLMTIISCNFADPRYRLFLWCRPAISSDFALFDTRIRMHRSRASGASNLSRYGLFCMALWCTLQSLLYALDRSKVAHGQVLNQHWESSMESNY